MKRVMRVRWSGIVVSAMITLAGLVAVGRPAPSAAFTIVVPNDRATTEGDSNNVIPFGEDRSRSRRVQQVFAASQFAALAEPGRITHLAFRPDAGVGEPFSSTIADIQINLSTTTRAPDGLSLTFADNLGADDTIVYGRGPLALSSADTGGPPRTFDIVIPLQIPFLYDPTQGNLLLDVRNFSGGPTTVFDAESGVGDSVDRVFSRQGGVNDSAALIRDSFSIGLVVQFTFDVTAPGSLVLFAAGLGLVAWRRKGS
jgi:hypothetical protein